MRAQPNSLVVSRGCPHRCDFCYKDAFFRGGRSFYTQSVDDALAEIERLPGRHLYFLDDHLFGDARFAAALFDGMRGMGRLWQAAGTVQSVLRPGLLKKAVDCWGSILKAASAKTGSAERLRHIAYAGGWKKFEPLWDWEIRVRRISGMLPLLETVLAGLDRRHPQKEAGPCSIPLMGGGELRKLPAMQVPGLRRGSEGV